MDLSVPRLRKDNRKVGERGTTHARNQSSRLDDRLGSDEDDIDAVHHVGNSRV